MNSSLFQRQLSSDSRPANGIFTALALSVILLSLLHSGCAKNSDTPNDGKPKIVATTGMVGYTVEVIGGDKVNLTTLMGPGVDPHLYRATKSDIDNLDQASFIFYNGLNLEAKMGEILGKMSGTKVTVAVGESIADSLRRFPSEFKGHPDPHVWFDVSLWVTTIASVEAALSTAFPNDAAFFAANAAAYRDTLLTLHDWVQTQIELIPKRQRTMVTAHDAFGYFGRAYGVEVKGLQGISTVSEAGLYDITKMIDMLVERKIKAVFVESSVPRKAVEAVVSGCEARGHDIVIGGELFSDAMGAAGTADGTYPGMVRHNVNILVKALK